MAIHRTGFPVCRMRYATQGHGRKIVSLPNWNTRLMTAFFEFDLSVPESAIDTLGHANNAVYLSWLQEAAIAHSAANGWSVDRYRELGSGWIARAHSIEYLAPAFEGDRLIIHTWVSGVRKVVSWRRYFIECPNRAVPVARAETKWAFVDFESLKPKRVPEYFWRDFQIVHDDDVPAELR